MNFRDRVEATKKILRERLDEKNLSAKEAAVMGRTPAYFHIFHPVPYQSELSVSRVKVEEYLGVALYELRKEEKEREKDSNR